jgi:hypothetical protein
MSASAMGLKGKYRGDRLRLLRQVPDKLASIKPQQPHKCAVVCSVNQQELVLLDKFYTRHRGERKRKALPIRELGGTMVD